MTTIEMTESDADQHIIKPADRGRIRCEDCNRSQPAIVCKHVHRDTGNTKGLSFWYFCGKHGRARGLKV